MCRRIKTRHVAVPIKAAKSKGCAKFAHLLLCPLPEPSLAGSLPFAMRANIQRPRNEAE
jgi:hypothetical protein